MSPNAKKVLIGTALIVGLIIWRGYNTNKTSALQDFTKNYNIYLNNEKRFFHYVAEQSEPGPVPQAEIMMPLTYSVNFLATTDDGCHRIPDKALADECSSAFADYHNVLMQVEKTA